MSSARPAVLSALLLVACGPAGSPASAPSDPQPDETAPAAVDVIGAWVLDRGVGPAGPIELVDGMRITLILDGPNPGGQACNHYGAEVRQAGDALSMKVTSMTAMACAEPIMRAESAYLAALEAVERAEREGDTLVLRGAENTELVFSLLPTASVEDLAGTRWRLESIVGGVVAADALGDATLAFGDDGTLMGSSGCREFTGSGLRANGDQLVMSTFGATDASIECPRELAGQDGHVFEVLGDGFIVELAGDALTLRDPSGLALVYRAAD